VHTSGPEARILLAGLAPAALATIVGLGGPLGDAHRPHPHLGSAAGGLRDAAPEMSRRQVSTSGMRIRGDHIASTIDTIVLAYPGTALPALLLVAATGASAVPAVPVVTRGDRSAAA
jgi:hypothetical protein